MTTEDYINQALAEADPDDLYLLCPTCGTALLNADMSVFDYYNDTDKRDKFNAFSAKVGMVAYHHTLEPDDHDEIIDPDCASCGVDTYYTNGAIFVEALH